MSRLVQRTCRFTMIAALLLIGGCATVKPWDRDLLAQKSMSFNATPMLQAIDEHIYFSKEASMGGIDVGGGGCGCN
jgi:Domain of unknown function (DUF4266)